MAPIKSRTNIIALIYDFDGTLSPGNMQEYRFMEAIGVDDKDAFWQEVDQMRDMHNANQILCSMRMMIEKARAAHVPITRLSFQNFGANIPLFPGVVEWFENIPECLPDEYFEVIIDKINDGEARHISIIHRSL